MSLQKSRRLLFVCALMSATGSLSGCGKDLDAFNQVDQERRQLQSKLDKLTHDHNTLKRQHQRLKLQCAPDNAGTPAAAKLPRGQGTPPATSAQAATPTAVAQTPPPPAQAPAPAPIAATPTPTTPHTTPPAAPPQAPTAPTPINSYGAANPTGVGHPTQGSHPPTAAFAQPAGHVTATPQYAPAQPAPAQQAHGTLPNTAPAAPHQCAATEAWLHGRCVPRSQCPAGLDADPSRCAPVPACPPETRYVHHRRACIAKGHECGRGMTWVPTKNRCVAAGAECGANMRWHPRLERCVVKGVECSDGQVWVPRLQKCVVRSRACFGMHAVRWDDRLERCVPELTIKRKGVFFEQDSAR